MIANITGVVIVILINNFTNGKNIFNIYNNISVNAQTKLLEINGTPKIIDGDTIHINNKNKTRELMHQKSNNSVKNLFKNFSNNWLPI